MVRLAAGASVGAALPQRLCLLATQALLILAFACGNPHVIATALRRYAATQGSAGALFGLFYYLVIAAGLGLLGWWYQGQPMAQPGFMLAVSAGLWALTRCARLA